ncbi:alpha/beta hydrolase [Nocardia sp. alder85J]|uniref:alpha/beta hydrolase n=1 Tax=Nocardia sp. alder85J TaxID=2862949 RepID=UPI001CD363B2|nr:alpha/beta hydrolase [Nocardia sp. alder85J]MCX4094623.1 alpha/beta hydrolase [Nocardia sp. alder85J]
MTEATLAFVHGLFSGAHTWDEFLRVLATDEEFGGSVTARRFEYATPVLRSSPLRRIPDLADIASNLREWLRGLPPDRPVVLITHSMGGLVVQRFLAERVRAGRLDELSGIAGVVMFSCPNQGSEIFLALRRNMPFWRHPQERRLRPLSAEVAEAQQIVIERIVHAATAAAPARRIPIWAFAGDSDRVVLPQSAKSVFADEYCFTLPGDHSSIIRPGSTAHRGYSAARRSVLAALAMYAAGTREQPAPPAVVPCPAVGGVVQSVRDSLVDGSVYQITGVGDVTIER